MFPKIILVLKVHTPKSYCVSVAIQIAITVPAIKDPLKADTKAAAIERNDPKIAPNNPETTAIAESAGGPTNVIFCFCSQTIHPAPAARPLRNPIARKHL